MLTLVKAVEILKQHQLLTSVIVGDQRHYYVPAAFVTTQYEHVAYDSRQVEPQTLFFCKGATFNPKYAADAIAAGASALVTERNLAPTLPKLPAVQLLVSNVQKAMAVLTREFYGNPDQALTMIGFTGTKGKTTSVYFLRHMLQAVLGPKVAQLSSLANCIDGQTYEEAHLTTPESLDLYRLLRAAVDHGMTTLVMEVSSQAYKKQRVYGLEFDYGVFLNISPDHISPIEHPDFDDYLTCKSQLIKNSRQMIISRAIPEYDYLMELADTYGTPVLSFGSLDLDADYQYLPQPHGYFDVATQTAGSPELSGRFRVMIPGFFNYENALAALIVARHLSADVDQLANGLAQTVVPGRMEILTNDHGYVAVADYAHNYLSLTESFKFLKHEYPNGRLIVVIGAIGSKAQSRRQDVGRALSEYADVAMLTSEDNNGEDPNHILAEIKANLTNPELEVHENLDRAATIKAAFALAQPGDVIFMAAKGREDFMREGDHNVPYVGDYQLARQLMDEY